MMRPADKSTSFTTCPIHGDGDTVPLKDCEYLSLTLTIDPLTLKVQ